MSRVSKDQVQEWIDNPVTVAVWALCGWERERLLSRPAVDFVFPGDPQITQERLIRDRATIFSWERFESILSGHLRDEFVNDDESEKKFSLLVEEDDEDSDGV